MKHEIIKTTLRLFLQKGIEKTSINDIARAVGISKPAIYYHFENKDALIEGVLTLFKDEMGKWSKELHKDDKTAKDFLQKTFDAIKVFSNVTEVLLEEVPAGCIYNFDELISQFSKSNQRFKEEMGLIFSQTRNHIKEEIIQGQNNGEIRKDIDPDAIALLIHSIIEGVSTISQLDTSIKPESVNSMLFEQLWLMIKEEGV